MFQCFRMMFTPTSSPFVTEYFINYLSTDQFWRGIRCRPRSQYCLIIMNQQYKQQPYRFFNLLIFLLSCLANSFIAQSLSTISLQIQYSFEVPLIQVNMCALVFMIIHPFMTFVANYILNRYGLKVGCTINAICVIIGVLIRILVKVNFGFVLAGNIFVAFGNVFIMNSPTMFSVTWFRPQLRIIVTSLAIFVTLVSGGLGALLSPFLVPENLTREDGKQKVFYLIVYQGVFVGVIMILDLIFLRSKPSSPPSPVNNVDRTQYKVGLKRLVSNRTYVLLFFQMTLLFGSTNAFTVTIQPFLAPFNFGSKISGIGLAITVLTGLIGSVVSGIIIRKTKKYKLIIMIEMGLGIAFCCLLLAPLETHVMPLFWIVIAGIGFFIYPIIPGSIELACQVVFPVGEALSTGFLLAGGQLFGSILGIGESFLIRGRSQSSSIIGASIYVGCFIIAMILFGITRPILRREEYQQKFTDSELATMRRQQLT